MTTTQAFIRLKLKFGILSSDGRFDSALTEALTAAVDRVAPYFNGAYLTQNNTVLSATTSLDFDTLNNVIDTIMFTPTGSTAYPYQITEFRESPTKILFTSALPAGTLEITYHNPYTFANFSTIRSLHILPILDFAASELATFLAGDKTLYNFYQQGNGARSVENMLQLSDFYEARALGRIREVADPESMQ